MEINGKEVSLSEFEFTTVAELVLFYKNNLDSVAIELNGKIIEKALWHSTGLKEEDKVEIIRFVGGG